MTSQTLDDSSSGSDNNHAMLWHNRERIAVRSNEKKHTQEDHGEELNTAQYAMVKSLMQYNTSW